MKNTAVENERLKVVFRVYEMACAVFLSICGVTPSGPEEVRIWEGMRISAQMCIGIRQGREWRQRRRK